MHSYAVRLVAEKYPGLAPHRIHDRLRYSTFVDLERLYMYFEVPKAGCTSLKMLLHDLAGLPAIQPFDNDFREVRREMFVHDRAQFAMHSLVDLDDATQWDVLHSQDFFRFTVVRNPYTRLQSAWRDKVLVCAPGYEDFYQALRGGVPGRFAAPEMIGFAEFVEVVAKSDLRGGNHHWRLQNEHIFSRALDFTQIGRLEHLDAIIPAFLHHAGYPAQARPPGTNRAVGHGAYDQALADRVYALYRSDFDAFDYARELAGPAQPDQDRRVPESRFIEEIAERNVVIGRLYAERAALRRQLHQLRAQADRHPVTVER